MKRYLIAIVILFTLVSPGHGATSTWNIDPDHSSIGFKISKLMLTSVNGSFDRYTSNLEINEENITSSQASVTIDAASINTNNAKRDEHLRSADYFDVVKYPTMTFVAKKVVMSGNEHYQVIGDLTLHGVTREVLLEVENLSAPSTDQAGHLRRHATAAAKINRKDYGLAWDSVLERAMMVGNEVTIILDIEMVKA